MAIKNSDGVLISYDCEVLINEVLTDSKEFRELKYIYAACRMEKGVKIVFDYAYNINDKEEMKFFEPLNEGEWFEKTTFKSLLAYLTRLNNLTNHYDDINELFNASGFSIKKFAEYIGAPYRTVQDWLAGKREPADYLVNLINEKMINDGVI